MTTKIPWPSATDYVAAMQFPDKVFKDAPLKAAVFEVDMHGIPDAATGSNAVVFKASVNGADTAVRCFTSEAGRSRERYETLARHRASTDVACAAVANWTEDALTLNRRVWPVVQMEWVEGRTLDEYVAFLCERRPTNLDGLADRWLEVMRQLAQSGVAHGDLQHGNVLVDTSARLRLVDLDGVWVSTGNTAAPPDEYGHPCYRHPEHFGPEYWGQWMDTFPGLLIYTTLLALHVRPDLWTEYHNGANLLFVAEDLRRPRQTQLWKALRELHEPVIDHLTDLLASCCDPQWRPTEDVERLLTGFGSRSPVPPTPLPPPVPPVSPTDLNDPWIMTPVLPDIEAPHPSFTNAESNLPPPPPVPPSPAPSPVPSPTIQASTSAPQSWWDLAGGAQEASPPPVRPTPAHQPGKARSAEVALTLATILVLLVLFAILSK